MSVVNLTKLADVAERTAATFAEAFLAFQLADASGVTQLSDLKAAAVAAGLAAGKYMIVQLNSYLGSPTQVAQAVKQAVGQ